LGCTDGSTNQPVASRTGGLLPGGTETRKLRKHGRRKDKGRHHDGLQRSARNARHLRQCRRRLLSRDLDQQRRQSTTPLLAAQEPAIARRALPHADNADWLDAIHIAGISVADLGRTIPALLDTAVADRLNLTIRPSGRGVRFIQLDDLAAEKLPALAPAMFLIIETSPGNHQAWLALPGEHDREFARRVRRGAGADVTASGATKIAGSLNFKISTRRIFRA
jgi:hypothetical protein